MTTVPTRFYGRHLRADGLVATPSTLAGAEVLADGQLAPVTDQPGVNLYVRKGGVLVPAVTTALEVNSEINMTVDPSTGVSPPSGTVVHSQADYDALGAPLLYIQDAIDILPLVLNSNIRINLAAGEHLAKSGAGGTGNQTRCCIQLVRGAMSHKHGAYNSTLTSPSNQNAYLYITGTTSTVVYAEEAGTTSGAELTRTSGSWTAGELRGKFVIIVTGAGAGLKYPIEENTTTMLRVAGAVFSPAGAVTFRIEEPAAVILPSSDGVTRNANPGLRFDGSPFSSAGHTKFLVVAVPNSLF
jgi:hypothetical protein